VIVTKYVNTARLFILLVLFSSLSDCSKQSTLSLKRSVQKQIIGFQPLDDFDILAAEKISIELSAFFKKPVMIFKPLNMPYTFYNQTIGKYSADSILNFLSRLKNDSIVEIVGLFSKPLYVIKQNAGFPYYDEKIFGVGHQPGNACIVSDHRFRIADSILYYRRIRNVITHEIGHNMNLSHCNNDNCIMSETYGGFNLDKADCNFCAKCIKALYR